LVLHRPAAAALVTQLELLEPHAGFAIAAACSVSLCDCLLVFFQDRLGAWLRAALYRLPLLIFG
jgi:hypothetical protein